MEPTTTVKKRRRGILDWVEIIGNALPDPATLFLIGAFIVMVVSAIAAYAQWESVLTDDAGNVVLQAQATNLLGSEGLRWFAENVIKMFVEFRPLGLVLVAAIGIAVAEKSGFIAAALKTTLLVVPSSLLTPATFFMGVMSSMAVDAGYIVLPPLAAALYKAVGRSPLVGLAAVFAGVAAGFNANLFITGLDPLLSGLTEEAAHIIDRDYNVNPACNWWFMIASTFVITFTGWGVTRWIVEPRMNKRSAAEGGPGSLGDGDETMSLTPDKTEVKGLLVAGVVMVLTIAAIVACVVIPGMPLYDAPDTVGPGKARPFATWIGVIVPLLILLFFFPGLAYGIVVKTIRNDRDVVRMMSEYMSGLGNYIVLAFFAAIFVKFFEHSGLGQMLAIEGGTYLQEIGLPTWALMVGFIVLVGFINMFVGSMSAKWAMLAVVFVPMLMQVGISPELTQASYRIGDSVTNSISPLNPYIVVVLMFMRQYVKKAGIGTLISLMLPYSIAFFVIWTAMLVVWIGFGWTLGIDAPLDYTLPGLEAATPAP
ncbi:MAG: AbgT family transporter [Phycisphaerales bacterium]|nr:MAG: AbgT family transporter [Phycisphaerales bacterium]